MTQKAKEVLHYFFLIIFLLVLFLLQTTPNILPTIGKAYPILIVPAIVCIGMFEREIAGSLWGLIAGLLWDMVSSQTTPFHSFALMCVGCISGLLITHLMHNNLLTGMILGSFSIFIYLLLYWFIFILLQGYKGAFSLYCNQFIPTTIYSICFIPILYYVIRLI